MSVWNTADECSYIATMGTHKDGSPDCVADIPIRSRLAALERYLTALDNRAVWGEMDPVQVRAFAESERFKLLNGMTA